MSSYTLKAKNKNTGEIKTFQALDNYFGSHEYGYKDEEGTTYDEDGFLLLYERYEDTASPKIGISDFPTNPMQNNPFNLGTPEVEGYKTTSANTMQKEEWEENHYHAIERVFNNFKNGATYSDSIYAIINIIHQSCSLAKAQERERIVEMVERIDTSGGGNGRRIKVQIITALTEQK